jgi:hypothetical protein
MFLSRSATGFGIPLDPASYGTVAMISIAVLTHGEALSTMMAFDP